VRSGKGLVPLDDQSVGIGLGVGRQHFVGLLSAGGSDSAIWLIRGKKNGYPEVRGIARC